MCVSVNVVQMRYLQEEKKIVSAGQYAHSMNPAIVNTISEEEISTSKEDIKANVAANFNEEIAIESVEEEILTISAGIEEGETEGESIDLGIMGTD